MFFFQGTSHEISVSQETPQLDTGGNMDLSNELEQRISLAVRNIVYFNSYQISYVLVNLLILRLPA